MRWSTSIVALVVVAAPATAWADEISVRVGGQAHGIAMLRPIRGGCLAITPAHVVPRNAAAIEAEGDGRRVSAATAIKDWSPNTDLAVLRLSDSSFCRAEARWPRKNLEMYVKSHSGALVRGRDEFGNPWQSPVEIVSWGDSTLTLQLPRTRGVWEGLSGSSVILDGRPVAMLLKLKLPADARPGEPLDVEALRLDRIQSLIEPITGPDGSTMLHKTLPISLGGVAAVAAGVAIAKELDLRSRKRELDAFPASSSGDAFNQRLLDAQAVQDGRDAWNYSAIGVGSASIALWWLTRPRGQSYPDQIAPRRHRWTIAATPRFIEIRTRF